MTLFAESDTAVIMTAVFGFLSLVVSGIMTIILTKMNHKQARAAIKVEEVAAKQAMATVKVEEVAAKVVDVAEKAEITAKDVAQVAVQAALAADKVNEVAVKLDESTAVKIAMLTGIADTADKTYAMVNGDKLVHLKMNAQMARALAIGYPTLANEAAADLAEKLHREHEERRPK